MQWSPKPSVPLITQGCDATRKHVFEVLYGSRDYHAAALSLAYLSFTVCKHHRLKLAADHDGYSLQQKYRGDKDVE